jgi:hypothetical protein
MWKVPEEERARWDAAPLRAAPPSRPQEQPKPLQQLVVELEAWIDLSSLLERQLRDAYEAEPLRVTRITANVVQGAESGRLQNPAGLLVTRLREIQPPALEGQPAE